MEKSFKGLKLRSKKKQIKKKYLKKSQETRLRPLMAPKLAKKFFEEWIFFTDLNAAQHLSSSLARRFGRSTGSRLELLQWFKKYLKKNNHINPLGRQSIDPPLWLRNLAHEKKELQALTSMPKWGFEEIVLVVAYHLETPTL
ncbi:MAG: hypothetical protein QE271_08370 [Bacteriovoracaceae bacterium]|nr:hypothetical protein [Bacteriovoracaceae bacterium]